MSKKLVADKRLVAEQAKELLDEIYGHPYAILIKLHLWIKLNEQFIETIEDIEDWDKAELLKDMLKLVGSHFSVRAMMVQDNIDGNRKAVEAG